MHMGAHCRTKYKEGNRVTGVHLQALQQKPAMTSEYALEYAKLLQAFDKTFQDMKSKQ